MAKLIEITGKAISGEWGTNDETGDGIPVLRTANFTNHGVVDYSNVVTRNLGRKDLSGKFLRHGDIIIEKSGGSDNQPVGRVIFFDGPENTYLYNNFTGLLRVNDQQHWFPRYVFYSLFANYRFGGTKSFENRTTGLHNLQTESYVAKTEIRETDLRKQIAICSLLDRIQTVITSRQRQLYTLDTLIKARFVEMFGDPTIHLDNGETKQLYTIADRITVGYVGEASNDYADIGIPYLRTQNVRINHIDLDGLIYVNESFHRKNSKSVIHPGDVVISRVGANRGMAAVIPENIPEANIANCLIVGKSADIDSYYLAFYLNMSYGKRPQFGASVGSAQGVVNTAVLKVWEVYVPDKTRQDEFVRFAKQVDKSKVAVQAALEKAQLLFDSLMQQYFG